jgi:hypothetical protein
MTEAEMIVKYALSQIGTAENPLGSNKQKYGAYLDEIPWYLYKDGSKTWIHKVNGFNWCTSFHDASFVITLGIDRAREVLYRPVYNNYGAVVKYAYNYYKAAGAVGNKPKKGCSIFFQNSQGLSHIGIVVDFTDTTVTTVEGNTSSNGKTSWYVAKKTYKLSDSYIYGFGYPQYKDVKPDSYPDTPFKMEVLASKKTGSRIAPYSDARYVGEISAGEYDVKEISGDYGKIETWVYLKDSNIMIPGQIIDGYTIGETYKVLCDELNVRTAADVKATKVTALKQGAEVTCKAITKDSAGNTWMRITKPEGWCAAKYEGKTYIG